MLHVTIHYSCILFWGLTVQMDYLPLLDNDILFAYPIHIRTIDLQVLGCQIVHET